LLIQGNLTEQLHEDAVFSVDKIAQGNKQLEMARKSNNRATRLVCSLVYCISFILLFFHWIG